MNKCIWVLSFLTALPRAGGERAIKHLQKYVLCPFARSATIWKNNFFWDSSQSLEKNVAQFIEKDLDVAPPKCVDVIALELPAKVYARDLESAAGTLKRILSQIDKKSIDEISDLKSDQEGYFWDDGWQFTYNGNRFFVTFFAPFYPENHSRYNYQHKHAVCLFQPEESFKRCLPKNSSRKKRVKESIRKLFAKKGQEYTRSKCMEKQSDKKAHEAPRYLKPMKSKDEVMVWWI